MVNRKYIDFLNDIYSRVKKNNNINVNLIDISFYGIHKWSNENVYKITFADDRKEMVIYVEEDAFNYWGDVPWSGQTTFRPDNWSDWAEDQKLILAWCWCIYKYCLHWHEDNPPPILE